MASAISSYSKSTSTSGSSSSSSLNGMTASDFLNLMIQQLQQQDPLNPTDSNQLLTQMSQISSLQSNTELRTTLESTALQQAIGASGNLIGKTVQGLDDNGNSINGLVTSVKVAEKKVYLELDSGKELAVTNVTQVAPTSATAADTTEQALQQIINNQSTGNSTLQQIISGQTAGNSNLQAIAQLLSGLKSVTN